MADAIGLILIIILSIPSLTALLVTLRFLMPDRVGRAHEILVSRSGRAAIVGVVNFLFFGILAGILNDGGGEIGVILAILIMFSMLGFAVVGLAGGMQLLHQRIYPMTKDNMLSDMQTAVRAALLLILALLSPIIGWFIFAPILLIISLGAGIMVVVRRGNK